MTGDFHKTLASSRTMRAAACWINRHSRFLRHCPVRVGPFGMVAYSADRYLALWLLKWGRLDRAFASSVARRCRPGLRAADIGANAGYYTLLMSSRAGETGRVWAFEPEPVCLATLRDNLRRNRGGNVTVVEKAVGAATGSGTLYIADDNQGDHRLWSDAAKPRRQVAVPVVALDDYFPAGETIDLIKIDVQGAELMVLRGMRRILGRHPVLCLEVSAGRFLPPGQSPMDTMRLLQDAGYRLRWVDEAEGEERPLARPEEWMPVLDRLEYANLIAE